MKSELIDDRHLARRAVIYIRQSSPHQVLTNQESLRLQYDLRRRALDLGWREEDIEVIDTDLGLSGGCGCAAGRLQRPDRACHAGSGRHRAVFRGHPSQSELLRLVSAAGSVWLSPVPDRRSRWSVRPGLCQWPAPAWPQRHDFRDGVAHYPCPPDRWPVEQSRTRRPRACAARRPDPRRCRCGGQGSRPRSAGPHRAGLCNLSASSARRPRCSAASTRVA